MDPEDLDDEQDLDRCEHRFCHARGVAYDENGLFLCEDHLFEAMSGEDD